MTPAELRAQYARQDAEALPADVRATFSTPAGRRVLMHLITQSGFFKSSSFADADRPGLMAFVAGLREAGVKLIYLCNDADPAIYQTAEAERTALIVSRRRELQTAELQNKERHV